MQSPAEAKAAAYETAKAALDAKRATPEEYAALSAAFFGQGAAKARAPLITGQTLVTNWPVVAAAVAGFGFIVFAAPNLILDILTKTMNYEALKNSNPFRGMTTNSTPDYASPVLTPSSDASGGPQELLLSGLEILFIFVIASASYGYIRQVRNVEMAHTRLAGAIIGVTAIGLAFRHILRFVPLFGHDLSAPRLLGVVAFLVVWGGVALIGAIAVLLAAFPRLRSQFRSRAVNPTA
jgi:hypothetical protein